MPSRKGKRSKGYAPLSDGSQLANTDEGSSGGLALEMTDAPTGERTALLNQMAVVRGAEVELERVATPPPKQAQSSQAQHDDHDAADGEPIPGPSRKKTSDADSDSESESDLEVFPPQQLQMPGVHVATMAQKRALWWRNVLVTGMFILSWYAFATLLSMYNKWMFSPEYYGFSYPLFVTANHMFVQFICASIIRNAWASRFRPVERPTRRDYVTRIFPTALTTGSDIGLSNLSLKTITLSLYTMCKSSALIFVLMFAFLFKLEKYSVRLIFVICLISIGVFMMVFNTTEASIPGIVMVISASAIGGLRWALTELIMHKKAMGLSNPFATIFWLTPLMGIILFIVSAIIEDWHAMVYSHYFGSVTEAFKTVGIIALPGVLAFAMVASEFFVIQRAGVVPLSIAGIAKEVSTITFSGWVFGDKLTLLNIIGCVVTICGIALYSFHKYRKSMQKEVVLDAAENPIGDDDDETAPLAGRHGRTHSRAMSASTTRSFTRSHRSRHSSHSAAAAESPNSVGVPLHDLEPRAAGADETHEDRVARLRDEFEGWDSVNVDSEEEASDDEVARRREEKLGGRSRWQRFWDGSM